MPDQPKTPHRTFRVDDELWAEFAAAVEAVGLDRSTVLRAFLAWYVRRSKARLPKRPDTPPKPEQPETGRPDPTQTPETRP